MAFAINDVRGKKEIRIGPYRSFVEKAHFCPNRNGQRGNIQRFLDFGVYRGIISELAEIDYRNKVIWHLYNEPIRALNVLVDRMSEARAKLSNALFSFNTNGDY